MLLALQENPLGTYKALAEVLDISAPTVKSRLESIIHKIDPTTPVGEGTVVSADLKLEPLGLELVDIIVEIKELANVHKFEKVFSEYPYALYRIRKYSPKMGLFIQVREPLSAKPHLFDLLNTLKDNNYLNDFSILRGVGPGTYSYPRLANWLPESLTWEFDWKQWKLDFENTKETIPYSSKNSESLLKRLQPIDIGILALLTENARRKQVYMIERLQKLVNHPETEDISPQKFSRRFEFVKENLTSSYRVHLDWKVFDIYNTALFVCKTSRNNVAKLFNLISSHNFPFNSNFKVRDPEEFTWFTQLSPLHFSNLTEFLWNICDEIEIHSLDYTQSYLYYFWPEVWDFENRSWKVSQDFLVNQPLERAKITD